MRSRPFRQRMRQPAAAARLALRLTLGLALLTTGAAFSQTGGDELRSEYGDLGTLLDSAWLSQARTFESIIGIDGSPTASEARERFAENLRMRANMSMADMMVMMRSYDGMEMPGSYDELEFPASNELTESLLSTHSRREVRNAYEDSSLPARAVEVLRRGHQFETRVFDILVAESVRDRPAALAAAVDAYLVESLSVPARPKPAALLLAHAHAGAFVEGFPRLSGIAWSSQWLRLAAMEAIIFEQRGASDRGSVATVEARFRSKLSDAGQNGSPVPVEMPMAPAIAPTLFSLSPQAAIILDNLNMLSSIVADVLAYPNLDNKPARIDALVAEFTNHAGSADPTIDYLVSALRAGIYNQGGPAVGELAQSERNRSRMEMGMRHFMIMPVP